MKVINTAETIERLRAYKKHRSAMIDIELLCIDLVILMKWGSHSKEELFTEVTYQWDRVHFDPTQKTN